MHERRKDDPRLEQLSGEPFPDWDNPEDMEEGAPEGYYDDEGDEDDSYEPGPDDPDYDLSEAAGYADWDEPRNREPFPRWIVAAVSIALLLAIVGGMLIRAT